MQTTFNLALNIVLKLNFLNTIFFMNFTGQILLKNKKDNSILRNILYSRVVTLMSFSFCWTWKCTQIHQKNLDDVLIWTYWWTVYFEKFKSTDLHAIENVFYLTSDHIIPFRLVRWKTLMLHSLMKGTLGHWCNIITRTMRMKELINEIVDWIIDYVLKHLT